MMRNVNVNEPQNQQSCQTSVSGCFYYEKLQLEDLENEIWVDAFEFDGIYEVSNLGRIKSLQREVNTRWGTPRLKEELILKQSIGDSDNLIVSLLGKTKSVSRLIFNSFYPNVDFLENECVMHKNKKIRDNRLENLKKVTRKKSKQTDMIKSKKTIIATPKNLKKAAEAQKEFYDNRTHKECTKCGKVDVLENFPDNVKKCQNCINTYIKNRRKNYVYVGESKNCNKCGELKKDTDFHKLNNTCKKCDFEKHKKFQDKQREKLGDWYVKEYGKYTYKIKEFTQKIIDELRIELIEKRKPKYHIDNLSFMTIRNFAKYILEKYKIPISTVEKRINKGFSEYECTLNRKEFVRHNIKRNVV
jgi:uncharacterized protein (DUF983 family)